MVVGVVALAESVIAFVWNYSGIYLRVLWTSM